MLNFKVLRERISNGEREWVVCSDRNEVLVWTGEVVNGEEVRKYIRIDCTGDAERAAATQGYRYIRSAMITDKEYWEMLFRGYKEVMPVNFIDLGEPTLANRRKEMKKVEYGDNSEVLEIDLSMFNF